MTQAAAPLRWGAAALAVALLAVYARTWDHTFVEFDDPLYVTENSYVQSGLSWETVRWAFTTDHAFVWHPLTWLSYLADAQLYGVERAGPWVATGIALHGLAAILLLVALAEMTGRLGASFLVAALFALHPVQVESVAWVSARKDVLAGVFFMATLIAYAAYVRRETPARYALVAAMTALCLLAKGTLVALPLVLLVLDVWPLRRAHSSGRLVLEKLPLLAIVVLGVAIQLRVVDQASGLVPEDPAWLDRIPIAIMALAGALGRLVWPSGLSIVYPTPSQMGLGETGTGLLTLTFLTLAGVSALALALWRRAPALTTGWLWFGLLIVPVTGLVPVGIRSMHDRYSYVPMIGLALALVFAPDLWSAARPGLRRGLAALAGSVVVVCAVLSWQQVAVWRDSFALFDHALAVNPRAAVVLYSRGIAWAKAGRTDLAVRDLEEALAIRPDHADAHVSLGHLRQLEGDLDAAIAHLRRGVALRPRWPMAHTNLARALEARGDQEEALPEFERAVEVGPRSANAHYWLGLALEVRGRRDEARRHYERALVLEPAHPWAGDALLRFR